MTCMPRCPAFNRRWTPTRPVGRERSAQQARRAINVPLTGVGSGTSRLLTDNRLARSARASRVNTSLCKLVIPVLSLHVISAESYESRPSPRASLREPGHVRVTTSCSYKGAKRAQGTAQRSMLYQWVVNKSVIYCGLSALEAIALWDAVISMSATYDSWRSLIFASICSLKIWSLLSGSD